MASAAVVNLASIPSPTQGVLWLGPIPLRGYALAIIVGVIAAIIIAEKRWAARGGKPGDVIDIAVVAVPFGLIGGRLYHVISTPEPYFGENGNLVDIFKIWEGGLGIWGAIALGALGAWIVCRRRGIKLAAFADALAPGLAVAQGIGRIGNWFNNELYGRATDLPWALQIYAWNDAEGKALRDSNGDPILLGTFHPTFLYEMLWNFGVAGLVVWADRKYKLGRGRAFALYVAAYCVGRFWIEMLRVDTAELILGQRLNVWTSILVFLGAVAFMLLRRGPREEIVRNPDDPTDPAAVGTEVPAVKDDQAVESADVTSESTDSGSSDPAATHTESPADGGSHRRSKES